MPKYSVYMSLYYGPVIVEAADYDDAVEQAASLALDEWEKEDGPPDCDMEAEEISEL